MLLSAEGGCLHDAVGAGRDRIREYKEALAEAEEAQRRGDLDEDLRIAAAR